MYSSLRRISTPDTLERDETTRPLASCWYSCLWNFRLRSATVAAVESVRAQFAANLREHRAQAGLSQEALADLCKLHRTEISLLERCKRSPRLETIVILARGLNLGSPAELLDGMG
jgi:DNA-binding XRE family transcriptional regulator